MPEHERQRAKGIALEGVGRTFKARPGPDRGRVAATVGQGIASRKSRATRRRGLLTKRSFLYAKPNDPLYVNLSDNAHPTIRDRTDGSLAGSYFFFFWLLFSFGAAQTA